MFTYVIRHLRRHALTGILHVHANASFIRFFSDICKNALSNNAIAFDEKLYRFVHLIRHSKCTSIKFVKIILKIVHRYPCSMSFFISAACLTRSYLKSLYTSENIAWKRRYFVQPSMREKIAFIAFLNIISSQLPVG